MTKVFWLFVLVDAALFLVLVTLGFLANPQPDGGNEMALVFSVIIPAIIVGAAVLLFVTSKSPRMRVVALVIVAGPGLLVAGARVRSAAVDYQVRRNAAGSGYFSERVLRSAGAAVVRRDVPALQALKGRVDVNAKGTRGMTLMELAVTQAFESPPPPDAGASSLDVVRALLALRADPNAGLEIATKLRDAAILRVLLDAGANPNYADDRGPVMFHWLNVMPLVNFTALLDHGLDLNLVDHTAGTPLIMAAAWNDRWELVLLLMARGANAALGDRKGTKLADVVESRMQSTMARPPEMKADIARVKAQLDP